MRQAKQHSQDLRETDEFLRSLIASDSPEKDKVNNHKPDNAVRQVNGRPKAPRLDPISRFSDPPAPPPQQPLPEKPDAARRPSHEPTVGSLKRTDTEKPAKPSSATSSPVSRESSQILSLIEALSTTRKELEAQNNRVKELEDLLRQERSARESAEEKARQSQLGLAAPHEAAPDENRDEDTVEQEVPEVEEITKPLDTHEPNGLAEDVETEKTEPPVLDVQAEKWQEKLSNMVTELAEMKQEVETFKQRAENAENESAETRKSLTEMIESMRREREAKAQAAPVEVSPAESQHAPDGAAVKKEVSAALHGVDSRHLKEVEHAVTALSQKQRRSALEHSTPYASMLGVVLLGVGLMAYLNGWQKIER